MSNEDNPTLLKKKRAIIKGSCTRINTYVDSITAPSQSVTAQLEERKVRLDSYWSEYNQVQTRLEMLEDAEADDRPTFEEAFYSLSARIRGLLSSCSSTRDVASPRSITRSHESPESLTNVRLPKLDLPSFSGKYDEWFPFSDIFNSVIHSNAFLSNVQRFQYLRASLTGDAKNIINSLEISNTNYDVAWTLLKERYDNQRVIVQNHIKAIMDLPSMIKENYAELRQITDGAARHLHALQALKRPVDHWDDLLVHVLSSKLDARTLREWQSSLTGTQLPTLKQFFDFITHQCQMLEATDKASVSNAKNTNIRSQSNSKLQSSCAATVKAKCNYCQGEHSIYYCKSFLGLPISRRIVEIRNRKICLNCLRSSSHVSNKCTSGGCKVCQAKHNTLLHLTDTVSSSPDPGGDRGGELATATSSALPVITASGSIGANHVILSTAVVHAYNNQGTRIPCRVLMDCGSQANLVSKQFAADLGLKPRELNVSISGIGGTVANSAQAVQIRLQSRLSSYTTSVNCIVVDRVTEKLPAFTLKRHDFNIPRNLRLADPQFHVSNEVDLLIGAEVFWDLLCVGQVRSSNRHPTLQKTRLGWILAGRLCHLNQPPYKIHALHAAITNAQLHDQLSRFWRLDHGLEHANNYTLEEKSCEQHFLENISRSPQGRFIVKLPIKEQALSKLGDSRDIALKRLRSLERRFGRDPSLKDQYTQFMKEYIVLGHMRLLNSQPIDDSTSVYLPHHCVYKVTNQSRKLRVVFDASCQISTGVSLNDTLMVGPVVQQDLMSILVRFRHFRWVFSADIIKMYRQVLLDPSQTCLQRILWRENPNDEVDTYELTTITYGTSSASYLATRCLLYLAEQYSSQFPAGSVRVARDFYVDDLLTGADTLDEAKLARDEIIRLLQLGSFELSKWASNCPDLLENLEVCDNGFIAIKSGLDSCVLGVQWNQSTDTFHFSHSLTT